jgi:hypothetical protein
MTWFGRLVFFVIPVAGFAAAHVLVQAGNAMEVPTVTAPTLTVPSLPVPTVSVPSTPLPTVSVPLPPSTTTTAPPVQLPPIVTSPPVTAPAVTMRPAPEPRPSQPTTTTAVRAVSQSPVGGTAPAPAPSPSSSDGEQPVRGPSTTRSQTKALEAGVHISPNRISVRLAFVLPKDGRRFLIVRGPAPSCRIAGYIPFRGRKGANAVYFAGRVHGRRLDPGIYLISLSSTRRFSPGAATEYVRVVSPRRSVPLPDQARKPACTNAAGLATDETGRSILAETLPNERTSRPTAGVAGVAVQGPTGDENDDGASGLLPDSGVLGAATGDADEKPFLAIAVVTIVAALLLSMLALVTRFLRGTWNP